MEGDKMTIGDRIRIKRTELNLSQAELAIIAGYSDKTAISKLEHAGDDISMKQIKRVAKALGTTSSVLLGWDDDATPTIEEEERALQIRKLYKYVPHQVIEKASLESDSLEEIAEAIEKFKQYKALPLAIRSTIDVLLEQGQSDV